MKTDVMLFHDLNLLENLSYNAFVPHPMINQDITHNQMTIHIDIVVEVHLVTITTKITTLNIDNALHLEPGITTTKVLLLHITLDHVMITIEEILVHTVHHIDLLIDHLTDVIHAQDTIQILL